VGVTPVRNSRVVVIGEALVDLVMPEAAPIEAMLGGAPYNTARALARLGIPVDFCGTVSVDRFGERIIQQLIADGVGTALVERCEQPTTLAAAELSSKGSADYRFYIDGTSAPRLERDRLDAVPAWIFTGGLGLVLEPLAHRVDDIVAARGPNTRVMVDVNVRPHVISDMTGYRRRVERLASYCDVVKVSDEDLAHLYPDVEAESGVQRLLECGASIVLVTAGGDAVVARTANERIAVSIPPAVIVDTIGAGDTFDAGVLTYWCEMPTEMVDPTAAAQIAAAVDLGARAARVVVGRRGADPPRRSELPPSDPPSDR
jgi:fructokinase